MPIGPLPHRAYIGRSLCTFEGLPMHHAPHGFDRRTFLQAGLAGLAASRATATPPQPQAASGQRTVFQIACMTLPYSQFPLERALTGLQSAGYRFVAWGTTHLENGQRVPVIAP